MIAFSDCAIGTFLGAWEPIRLACERHGRDPQTLSRGATVAVNFTDGPYEVIPTAVPFSGSISQIADRFAEYADQEAEHVSVIPHPWNEEGLDKLAEVMAYLRRSMFLSSLPHKSDRVRLRIDCGPCANLPC